MSEDSFKAEIETSVSNGYKKYSEFHLKLATALKNSKVLIPEHVEVVNLSYYYDMKRTLKPKKLITLITKPHVSNGTWESYIWKMKRREEDYELVPQKHYIGAHKSKWLAFRSCEKASIERDANPAEVEATANSINPSKILNTNFKILIVSNAFDRLNTIERIELVYEELLNLLGSHLIPSADHKDKFHSMPSKMKYFSYFGNNVSNLKIFKFLLFKNTSLIIEAKTPSQWKPKLYPAPNTERYGSSHFDLNSLSLPNYALAPNTKSRVKQLAVNVNNDPNARMAKLIGNDSSSVTTHITTSSSSITSKKSTSFNPDFIGVDPLVSGVSFPKKKTGGVYGHFFHDLSPSIKELVMGRYLLNKKLIQAEGVIHPKSVIDSHSKPKKVDTFQPKTTMSMLRKKIEKAATEGEYDKGTNSESEMIDDVFVYAKTIDRYAVPLQRLWRIRALKIAMRTVWRRSYAVLVIQRVVRGMYARRYARILRRLYPIAATRIQRCYQSLLSRRRTAVWQTLTYRLSRAVLPKMKLFLKKCFLSWIAKRYASSVKIQSVIRMYSCKVKLYKRAGEFYILGDMLDKAAIKIQKVMRGRWGRISLTPLIEAMLFEKVDIPCAICIQRIVRGKVGKILVIKKRAERKAAIVIQKLIRRFLYRSWRIRLKQARLEYYSALQIQRIYRGRLDRELSSRLAKKRWYVTKFIPAVILVQTWCRMFVVRREYQDLRRRKKAATVIQRCYRYSISRAEALARWHASLARKRDLTVAQMQKIVRAFQARKLYKRMAFASNGKRILAAKTILRAWINFRNSKRFITLLEEFRVEMLSKKIVKLQSANVENELDRKEIHFDIHNIKKAIQKTKDRIKSLDVFRIQAEVRLNTVAKELKNITTEDFERGWAEAYDQEYSSLNQMLAMANQEMRCLRVKLNKQNTELLELHLELESCEIEEDEIANREIEAMEALRRAQVGIIERKLTDHKNRLIRREKCKWKIDSKRLKVIQRNRDNLHGIIDKAKSKRDISYATTVSYEKRAKQWDKESLILDKFHANKSKSLQNVIVKGYEDYATPVQETYDNVVYNTLSLLRGWSMDDKARVVRENTKKQAKKKRARGQFAPLKEEFANQNLRAFDYLEK